eukprot:gene4326-8611_t
MTFSILIVVISLSIIFVVIVGEIPNPLCPISSLLNSELFENPKIHSYPMDIFDTLSFKNTPKTSLYNCTAHDNIKSKHYCSSSTKCPLHEQNIIDANKSFKLGHWNITTSFCHLYNLLQYNTSEINVIILGGSVTSGMYTGGCCCLKSIDEKCPASTELDNDCQILNHNGHCSWMKFFYRWLTKTYPAKINLINLTGGGKTSVYTSEVLISELQERKITQLSKNDIIFLDHSVNDAESYPTKILNFKLEMGVDALLRRIYHYSTPHSWPTVILLEQWPFPSNDQNIKTLKSNNNIHGDYSKIYIKIASRFELPLWSYKEILWSKYMLMNQLSIVDPLLFHYNRIKRPGYDWKDTHPPCPSPSSVPRAFLLSLPYLHHKVSEAQTRSSALLKFTSTNKNTSTSVGSSSSSIERESSVYTLEDKYLLTVHYFRSYENGGRA